MKISDYPEFPTIPASDPVKYDKYRVKIEYYKDVYNGDENMTDKPTEVISADLLTIVLNNQRVLDPVLRNHFENLIQALHKKLEEK